MEIITSIITLLVGSAAFIIGMNMMSGGLKKATGKGLKKLLRKIQNNRLAGLGIGAAVTALIQSSAATSVMAIGFINAGVMTIFQGVCIILGGYIGTTITGVLASLSSLGISSYLMLLAFIGVILIYFKNEKVKNIGEILSGLGLLFFGLETMKSAFFAGSSVYDFCQNLFTTISNPFALLIIGAIFTALVQSSSATTGIVIVMAGANAVSLANGFYLVLGATIGTVITTIIATIGGNSDVKRTGFICLVIRIICALIATILLILFKEKAANFFLTVFKTNEFAVAMFLVAYNVIFMMALLPFVQVFVKLSKRIIKDKEDNTLKDAIKFIDNRLLNTPTIALMQVEKEILNMMKLAYDNLDRGFKRIINQDNSMDKIITVEEDKIDYINNEITNYLINLSTKVDKVDEEKVGSFFHVINDIERIGDHAYNFYEMSEKMVEQELKFSSVAEEEFNAMYGVIKQMCDLSLDIFENKDVIYLSNLHTLEDETDKLKLSLSDAHYTRISNKQCNVKLSPYYTSLVTELERIADHIVNIGYSIINPTGDDGDE